MKAWYTAQELSLARLPDLPETVSAIIRRAKKAVWQFQNRAFGKGLEYHISSLPPPRKPRSRRRKTAPFWPTYR